MVCDTAHRKLMTAARSIQAVVRMMNGKLYVMRMRDLIALQHTSAAKIQKAFRGRFSSMRYTTNMRIMKKKRQEQKEMARINFLLSKLWAQKQDLKRQNDAQRRITLAYRVYQRFKHFLRNRHNYATRIQRAFRNYKMSGLVGLTRYLIRNRQFVQFSDSSHRTLDSMLHGDQTYKKGRNVDREAHVYQSPGFRQGTPAYNRTLNQQVIYCNRSFTSEDCVLLGSVLRNPLCRTRKLIFHFVNAKGSSWEFDMIPAIGRCRSLRAVSIFGGTWPGPVVQKLLHEVETENPMIQTFQVESVGEWKREVVSEVNICTAKLLLNFFNYSVPGIHTLSLHGLGLIDLDIAELAKGLEVNTSLQTLCLSLNMVEDTGLGILVQAMAANRKCIVKFLDLSWNMLTLGDNVCQILDDFRCPPKVAGRCLVIDTTSNRIKNPYLPAHEARDDLEVLTTELTMGADNQEVIPDAKRGTTSNRILHRQKSELGEEAAAAAGLPSTPKRLRPVERPNNQMEVEEASSPQRARKDGRKPKNKTRQGGRTEHLRPVAGVGTGTGFLSADPSSTMKTKPLFSQTV